MPNIHKDLFYLLNYLRIEYRKIVKETTIHYPTLFFQDNYDLYLSSNNIVGTSLENIIFMNRQYSVQKASR